jgi:hypothetical protein
MQQPSPNRGNANNGRCQAVAEYRLRGHPGNSYTTTEEQGFLFGPCRDITSRASYELDLDGESAINHQTKSHPQSHQIKM